jgi:NitT/TauT family transport system substrate-binding protein
MNKKIGWVVVVIIILVVLGFWYNSSRNNLPLEITKVKIAYLPVVNTLPMALAIEKGYFKEAGLEVEAVKFEAPNQIVDAIMQDKIDFIAQAVTAVGAIADYKNPGKMKIFSVSGGTKDVPNENLLVAKDSSISSYGDLKGKKIAIMAGSIQWKIVAKDVLAKNGLDMDKDVTIVELANGLQIQALASKQVDAILLALEPLPTIAVNTGVAKILVKGPAENLIADPFYPGAGWVNSKFAKENPQTTKLVISILDKAMKEVANKPEASRVYLKGYTTLTDELISKVPLTIFKSCEDLTTKDEGALQAFLDIYTTYKVVDGKINLENLLYCK